MSVQSNRPRRKLSKIERREQILDAALRAFLHGGYEGTHVSQIVAEAGVARGTFYLHFQSKHEVFAALVERMLGIFLAVDPGEPERELVTREDVLAFRRTTYLLLFGTFHAHRGLVRLLFEEAVGVGRGFREQLEAHYAVWHGRVAEGLQELIELGVARPDLDVEVTSEMVIGMVVRLTRRYLFTDEDVDLDRLVDALVTFEIEGVSVPD